MTILIENTGVLIRNINRIEEKKDILIEDNYIKKIGKNLRSEVTSDCYIIDASNKVVMPGFVNSHTHLYQSMLRGCRDDLTLKPWCEQVTFPFANLVHQYDWNYGDIEAGYYWTILSSIEMIHSGITCCINMDLTLDSIFEAWNEIGMRGIGAVTAVNRWIPKELCRDDDYKKKEIEGFIKKWHQDPKKGGLLQVFMAPSTPFACTSDFLDWLMLKAEEYNLGVQTHVSETKWEIEQSLNEVNTTPLMYLDKINFLRRPITAAHCIHLTDEEIDLAVAKGVIPIYNPKSNMKLGSGIAPVVKMLRKGLNVALATDGAASNDQLDMFEEMRAGVLLQKVANEDPSVISAEDVFKMATENGAKAARIDAGVIDEGKLADLIILNLNQAHSGPIHNIIQNIVYCAKSCNVETSIINGKVVMENGKITNIDEEPLIQKAIEIEKEKFGNIDFGNSLQAEF